MIKLPIFRDSSRARDHATVQSILISGSLLAVTFVVGKIGEIDRLIASVRLIGAMLLIVLSGVWYFTTEKVNKIFWGRVHDLEDLLEIEVGNRGLYKEKIKGTTWYSWRELIWPSIFVILFLIYLVALVRIITLH